MFKSRRKLLKSCTLLACGLLLAGGVAIGLRSAAANSKAKITPSEATQSGTRGKGPALAFKAVPTTGPVTFHGAGRGTPKLFFQDAHDLSEGDTVATLNSSSGVKAQPLAMLTADMTGDGLQDIVTSYSNGSGRAYATLRSADGAGQFSDATTFALPHGLPVALSSADFNLDGIPDLAVANADTNTTSILLGNGRGSFEAVQELSVGSTSRALLVADLNHRGLASIVVGDASGEFRIFSPEDSTQSYDQVTPRLFKAGAGIVGIEAIGLNNDPYLDLAVATTAGVELWYGSETGDFVRQDTLSASGQLVSMATSDLNLDSYQDVVAVNANGAVTVWTNQKGKGFSAGQTYSATRNAVRVRINYMDVDAYPDVVVVDKNNSQLGILLNKKGRGFESPVLLDVDSNPVDLAIGKFDHDGVSDVVVAKQGGGSQVAALTYVPNQGNTITVTDLSGLRQIPANGTTTDISILVHANRRVTFLDAFTAAKNTPGPQTIQFQISDAVAANLPGAVPPSLAGINLREPGMVDDPLADKSIFPPNILSLDGDLSGSRLYNISLVGVPNALGLPALTLNSPNGDGTVIIGKNVAGTNYLGEVVSGNVNLFGPDIRIIGDNTFNTAFEIAAANCQFQNLAMSGFTKSGTQSGPGASAVEFDGVLSAGGQVLNCFFGALDLFGSAMYLGSTPANFSFRNQPALPADFFLGNRRGIRINGTQNITVSSTGGSGNPFHPGGFTIISGNRDHGILVEGGSPTSTLTNLFIGVLANGSTPFGNGYDPAPSSLSAGLEVRNSAGGSPSASVLTVTRCVIDASGTDGVTGATVPGVNGVALRAIGNNNGPRFCQFTSNIIGLQADGINPPYFPGLIPARNTGEGVLVELASTFNTFTTNTSSGNTDNGFLIRSLGTHGNQLVGNMVGTDTTGRLTTGALNDRGNQANGMVVSDQAALNTLDGNTISNNQNDGLQVVDTYFGSGHPFTNGNQGTDGNVIQNNKIGTDSGATTTSLGAVLGNGRNGIRLGLGPGGIDGNAHINTIRKNLIYFNGIISGNVGDRNGILMEGDNCDLNVITQNSIVGNQDRGIRLQTNLNGVVREGPSTAVGTGTFAQEMYTVTVDDEGTAILPEMPANPPVIPTNQPRAAVTVDSALLNGSVLQVTGRLGRFYVSNPNLFTVEVFASSTSSVPGASNNAAGVAQRFLGATTVAATVIPSTWSITTTGAQIGDVITATLRSPGGSTSEISVAKLVDQGPVTGTPAFSFNRVVTGPPLSLTPISTLDFGDVPINTSLSAAVRILSTGTGGAAIQINSITLTGAGGTPAQFTLSTTGITFPITLTPTTTSTGSPGSFIDFTVTALPTTIGVKTGEVTVNIVTTIGSNFTLPLRVNGTGQQISVSPTSLNFGSIQVGSTSALQNVTVSNTGSAPLNISFTLSGGDYIFDPGFPLTGPAIGPNGLLNIPIRFKPTTTGTRTGTLTIVHDAPNQTSPITVSLTGVGTAPPAPVLGTITLNGVPVGNLLDFGSVSVGSSKTLQLVLSNSGNANLTFTGTISGDAFSGTISNTTIAPGGTAVVNVTFTPPTTGDFSGTLIFGTNASNAPTVSIALTGKGVAPSISLNPTSITFGTVVVNQTATQSLSITNTGNAVLTVNSVTVNGQGFQVVGVPGTPFQVQPGSSQSFQVSFTPTATGSFNGTVTVTSNARNAASVSSTLSGSGGDNISPTVTISSPRSGDVFAAGNRTTAQFSASDNIGVTGIDVLFSDGGSFNVVVTGLPGTTTSFDINFSPLLDTTNARVRVVARDAAGNTGSAETGSFTVGQPPLIIGPKFSETSGKLKLLATGSNISFGGAVLLINNSPVPLVAKRAKFITSSSVAGLIPKGVPVQLAVRNPNGVTGPAVTFSR